MHHDLVVFSWKCVILDIASSDTRKKKRKALTQLFVADQRTGAAPEAGQGRSATRRFDRARETTIGETLKITFLFERRYLGNG